MRKEFKVSAIKIIIRQKKNKSSISSAELEKERAKKLEEEEKMCDRIGILSHGELVALDTTKNLLNKIQTKVVNFITDKKPNIKENDLKSLKVISNENGRLCVSYEKSKINIDQIINYLIAQNIKIFDISTDDGDLEDVFLRLTKN